jgi:hypothetical protein
MRSEERLSELLHDSRWSLPEWPPDQVLARIRRAARRQRLSVAAQSAAVAVIVGVAVLAAVPSVMRGDPPSGLHPSHGVRPAGSTRTASYPAALGSHLGAVPCPAPAGLEAPGPATPAEALAALRLLGAGLAYELSVTDKTVRPTSAGDGGSIAAGLRTAAGRRTMIGRILRAAPMSVRYSGPLKAGVGELAAVRQQVAADCGDPVMRSTWVIVSGVPGSSRSLDAELLFLTWRGHVLLYDIQ